MRVGAIVSVVVIVACAPTRPPDGNTPTPNPPTARRVEVRCGGTPSETVELAALFMSAYAQMHAPYEPYGEIVSVSDDGFVEHQTASNTYASAPPARRVGCIPTERARAFLTELRSAPQEDAAESVELRAGSRAGRVNGRWLDAARALVDAAGPLRSLGRAPFLLVSTRPAWVHSHGCAYGCDALRARLSGDGTLTCEGTSRWWSGAFAQEFASHTPPWGRQVFDLGEAGRAFYSSLRRRVAAGRGGGEVLVTATGVEAGPFDEDAHGIDASHVLVQLEGRGLDSEDYNWFVERWQTLAPSSGCGLR